MCVGVCVCVAGRAFGNIGPEKEKSGRSPRHYDYSLSFSSEQLNDCTLNLSH